MEKIIKTKFQNYDFIVKIISQEKYFIEYEILYPFEGVRNQYFSETTDLSEIYFSSIVNEIFGNSFHLYKVFDEKKQRFLKEFDKSVLPSNSYNLRPYLAEKRNDMLQKFYNECIEKVAGIYISKKSQEELKQRIKDFLIHKKTDFKIYSPFDYSDCLHEILYQNSKIKDIESGDILTLPLYWYKNFKKSEKFSTYSLKKLEGTNYTDNTPHSLTKKSDFENFCKKEENIIPFFLSGMNGTIPKITGELLKNLEQHEVAFLEKMTTDANDLKLCIYRISNGQKILIESFDNLQNPLIEKQTEKFNSMKDYQKLNLFRKMIKGEKTEYDELLRIWWNNRY